MVLIKKKNNYLTKNGKIYKLYILYTKEIVYLKK